jgi:hypothetical protein
LGFYGLQAAGVYLVLVVSSQSAGGSYPSPAFFLPLIPAGGGAICAGLLLAMDYQGVRAVFRRSFWVRIVAALPPSYDMAGPYGAGLLIASGLGLLIGGVVAVVYLAG